MSQLQIQLGFRALRHGDPQRKESPKYSVHFVLRLSDVTTVPPPRSRLLTRAPRIRAANVRERCWPTERLLVVKLLDDSSPPQSGWGSSARISAVLPCFTAVGSAHIDFRPA